MSKTVYIDLETTGLNAEKHGIWQLAAIFEEGGEVKDQICLEMKPFPGKLVSPQALAHSRMTLDELKLLQEPLAAFRQLEDWLGKFISKYKKTDKSIFKAYNGAFDYQFMRQWYKDAENDYFGSWFLHPYHDILQKAAYVLTPERYQMENFKLGTVCRYVGIDFDDEMAHDGAYDIRKTRELDKYLDTRIMILSPKTASFRPVAA